MTEFIYLTYEQVVVLNSRHGGAGAGVRDEAGIRAQLGRVEASFMGHDRYPTLVEKAAVILHGLSSTQGFFDGNKRTAWLATVLFLGVNGFELSDMADVEAEALVLSIATKAFENDDEPARGVVKAAEWLAAKQLTMSARKPLAFLAEEAEVARGHGTFNATRAMSSVVIVESIPDRMLMWLVLHLTWLPIDADAHRSIRVTIEPSDVGRLVWPDEQLQRIFDDIGRGLRGPATPAEVDENSASEILHEAIVSPPLDHPDRRPGFPAPLLFASPLPLLVARAGKLWIRVEVDGELVSRLPLDIHSPDSLGTTLFR